MLPNPIILNCITMSDKTALGISPELRQYIEALVEEVVLEGKSFENQKKYLQRFCENEGISFRSFETRLTTLFETMNELKAHESKGSERLIRILGEECYLSEDKLDQLLSSIITQRAREKANRQTKKDIEKQVKAIIADRLGVDESELTASTEIIGDLGADSLDIVDLLMEFEKVFQISLTDDELLNGIKTVGDIINRLSKRQIYAR